jgi:mannose-6-phosphate isomerase-like protein (cupin superfamily)
MKSLLPTAEEYASEKARHAPMTVVDVRARQAEITDAYRNEVLLDVNDDCVRLAVFEGEYRWHRHPRSDELFLVVAGELQIDFADGRRVSLTEWQSLVVPAGTVHRTRAVGRTVNLTCEKQGAEAEFVDPPVGVSF